MVSLHFFLTTLPDVLLKSLTDYVQRPISGVLYDKDELDVKSISSPSIFYSSMSHQEHQHQQLCQAYTTDNQFAIRSAITVASPNGGESYPLGSPLPTSWTYVGDPGATVNIEVFKGTILLKTLKYISIGDRGYGSYNVPIPSYTPQGNDYWIRITSTKYPACTDASNGSFTISASG